MALQTNFKPETLAKLAAVQRRISNGEGITGACKAEGMASSQMYALRQAGLMSKVGKVAKATAKKRKAKSKPKFVDMVAPLTTGGAVGAPSVGSVAVVICSVDKLKEVLTVLTCA